MTSFSRSTALALVVCAVWSVGCEERPITAQAPLRPLMYTEVPELTTKAAEVRERRLMRELIEGAEQDQAWGHMVRAAPAERADNPEALGRLVFTALMRRDEARWEQAFVKPREWASMVKVDLERAGVFADELLADSASVWDMFEIARLSEAPEGGLESVFEFEAFELGVGRTLRGRKAKKNDIVAQYWGNTLRLRLKGKGVSLEVRAPKVLRLVDRATGAQKLTLAAPLVASDELETFVEAGLYLKSELLRSQEYPYPLAVGNFWRYRREERSADGELLPSRVDEVLVEVVAVERYGSVRLAKLRWSYNDPDLTKKDAWWLLTPRRVYACDRRCRRRVERVNELMENLRVRAPLFEWPLSVGAMWREGEGLSYTVAEAPEEVQVPAGRFVRPPRLVAKGMLGERDPFMNPDRIEQWMARGEGVIKVRMEGVAADLSRVVVVEELMESRLMQ